MDKNGLAWLCVWLCIAIGWSIRLGFVLELLRVINGKGNVGSLAGGIGGWLLDLRWIHPISRTVNRHTWRFTLKLSWISPCLYSGRNHWKYTYSSVVFSAWTLKSYHSRLRVHEVSLRLFPTKLSKIKAFRVLSSLHSSPYALLFRFPFRLQFCNHSLLTCICSADTHPCSFTLISIMIWVLIVLLHRQSDFHAKHRKRFLKGSRPVPHEAHRKCIDVTEE